MFKKIQDKMFKRKLEKLGFNMEDEENNKIAFGFTEKVGMNKSHFLKCMEDAMATKKLQQICELLSGRKEAGRYLQRKPLVIQCYFCQGNFAIKEGIDFAGATINLESLENIIKHLIFCGGVFCDCGKKVLYFDKCKNCGLNWGKRKGKTKKQLRTKKVQER